MTCWYPAATSDSWFLAVRLFACTLVSSSKLALAAVVHESGQPPDEDMYLHDGLESDKQNTSVSACLVLSAQDASLLPIWFRRFSYWTCWATIHHMDNIQTWWRSIVQSTLMATDTHDFSWWSKHSMWLKKRDHDTIQQKPLSAYTMRATCQNGQSFFLWGVSGRSSLGSSTQTLFDATVFLLHLTGQAMKKLHGEWVAIPAGFPTAPAEPTTASQQQHSRMNGACAIDMRL